MASLKRKRIKAAAERPVVMGENAHRGPKARQAKRVGPGGPPGTNLSMVKRIAPAGGRRRSQDRDRG